MEMRVPMVGGIRLDVYEGLPRAPYFAELRAYDRVALHLWQRALFPSAPWSAFCQPTKNECKKMWNWLISMVNVGKYTIHGLFGIYLGKLI